MSWHYLQGQEAASWEGSSLDGAPSALLKLIPTPAASCLPDKLTDALTRSPFGMTLRRSTGTSGAAGLMWFRGDSPVRTYHAPETETGLTVNALDCGPRWPGSLARCSPPLSGWKTRQCSLFGGLTEFSGTWPRWGMMRDGECFPHAMPVLPTFENGVGYTLPTARASRIAARAGMATIANIKNPRGNLEEWVYQNEGKPTSGYVTPALVEWVMMWPHGWTDCTCAATDRFRQWLDSHGRR